MANGALYTKIKVADALKALALKGVTVQVAKPAKIPVLDGDKQVGERDGYAVTNEPLAPAHVISAKKWANGQITITTIDGKRYPAKADTRAAAEDEEVEAPAKA